MCDGDKALVVEDKVLVDVAKRNMEGIVPLYYKMAKAGAQPITPEKIYDSMILAYVGGNIGGVSNSITKIYNSNHGVDLDAIKLLCLESNFKIDYAKTLYQPERPAHIDPIIQKHTQAKVPYFFMEAKQKSRKQVAPINNSTVNRIRGLLPAMKLNFNWDSCGKFDWRMLCSSTAIPRNDITQKIVDVYKRRTRQMKFRMDDETNESNHRFLCEQLRADLLAIHPDPHFVCDVLVRELFDPKHSSKRKTVFWECFGGEVVEHLRKNVDQNQRMCICCGKRFYRESNRQVMCHRCANKERKKYLATYKQKRRLQRNI